MMMALVRLKLGFLFVLFCFVLFCFVLFLLLKAAPMAYRSSQATG